MTRLRTPALYLLLSCSAACSFHSSWSTGTNTGGTPETREHAQRPAKPARETTHYTAPAAHNHADHEVACTTGDDAAKARCEERKRQAQAECDAIDRETHDREAQAEADARRQEEEADAEAARQRKQAEEESAQREREAEAQAGQQPSSAPGTPSAATPPPRTFQSNRGSIAAAVDKQTIATEGTPAPRQGQVETPAPVERRKSDLREALQRRQNQIDQENAEKKERIKKALGRTKADILVAAQKKRNEVHASLKEAAASP